MASDSKDETFQELRQFFSATEWEEMSRYEKGSYRSAMQNYHAMLRAGNATLCASAVIKPSFSIHFEEMSVTVFIRERVLAEFQYLNSSL